MADELLRRRKRLVQLIEQLPVEELARVEGLLADLSARVKVSQSGDASPHSTMALIPAADVSQSGDALPHSTMALIPAADVSQSGDALPHSKIESTDGKVRDWPHAPVHRLSTHGTYIVTASTVDKQHLFAAAERLDLLEKELLGLATEYDWQLEAWAVFSNHYHFVAHATEQAKNLRDFLRHLHGKTARELNRHDNSPGRRVWHNYWDTKLTFERSYLARLNYVHQNAVKHGLVRVANQYRWCSAAWFERMVTPAQVKTIYSFKIDQVRIRDDFDPV